MQQHSESTSFLNSSVFLWILIILGSVLSMVMFRTLHLHDDNVQILLKVHKLLFEGEWSHFGNRGSGVGFVPGSLMTVITALPMKLWFSPYAAGIGIFLSQLISLFLLRDCGKSFSTPLFGGLIVLFFWMNPWRIEQMELYNPAYLFLFGSVHLWSGLKMKEKSFWATLIHVLSIGLCVQIHFSALILGITSLILLYYRWFRVHWFGFICGCTIVVASLIPWFLAYISQPELAITVADPDKAFLGRNFLYVYPILKAALYWVRYCTTYFARHIFTEIHFAWISFEPLKWIVSSIFHSLKWIVALVSLGWSLKIQWQLFKNAKSHSFFKRSLWTQNNNSEPASIHFKRYLVYLFLGMVLTAGLSPVEFNHWHLILCFPALSVYLSHTLALRLQRMSPQKINRFAIAVTLMFATHALFAALGSRSHSASTSYHIEAMKFFDSKKK